MSLFLILLGLAPAAADGSDCVSPEAAVVSDLNQLVDPQTGETLQPGNSVAIPGAGLVIRDDYKASISRTSPKWGALLNDISSHEPHIIINGQRIDYTDRDHITHAHEMSHGIASRLRNDTPERDNGYYLFNDQYVLIREPGTTISQTAAMVPSVFRDNGRYQTYISPSSQLVRSWNDTPTYTLDEWVAYTNGAMVGVQMAEQGLWDLGNRDAVAGVMEFTVYSVAMAMAVQRNDPDYWEREPQLKEFVAFNIQRAMEVYRRGLELPEFVGGDVPVVTIGQGDSRREVPKDVYGMWKFHHDLLTHPSAEPMRQWLRDTYGEGWVKSQLGF